MARRDHDNYSTDIGLARWAVRHAYEMAFTKKTMKMLEPCCGDDAPFATAARERGATPFGFDIRDVSPELWHDTGNGDVDGVCEPNIDLEKFSEEHRLEKYDIIATNPPFKSGQQVISESLSLLAPNGVAAFLIKVAFLGTQKRSKMFIDSPPAEVHILTARPSFTGDGGTDIAQEYCFAFWYGDNIDRILQAKGLRTTRLYWLDNLALMTKNGKKRVRIEKGAVKP